MKAALEKSHSGHNFHTLAKQLKALSAKIITKDLLRATNVGKTLTVLSNLQTPADRGDLEGDASTVRSLATELLAEWKRIVLGGGTANKKPAEESKHDSAHSSTTLTK